jgi:hypothetical protein
MTLENLVRIRELHSEPPDKRYIVFQCLVHTVNINKSQIKIFSVCHDRRNLSVYEGHLEVDEPLLEELIANTKELLKTVNAIDL